MATVEDRLQILNGVLIILSLALLCCWYKKNREYLSGPDLPGLHFKQGMSGPDLPGLHFKEGMRDLSGNVDRPYAQNPGMNELVNPGFNRNVHTAEQSNDNPISMRWNSKMSSTSTNKEGVRLGEISSDILTPIKNNNKKTCNSHSNDVLTKTDYSSEFTGVNKLYHPYYDEAQGQVLL
jgi:hypothetical protein